MYQAGEAQSGNHQARPHAAVGVEKAVVNLWPLWSLNFDVSLICLVHPREP